MSALDLFFRRRLRKVLPRLASLAPAGRRAGEVRVLMYHRVAEIPGDRLAVVPGEFARQMDLLLQSGRPVKTLSAAFAGGGPDRERREPAVVLTFDDGYRDFYDNVFPILRRRSLPATVFVVPGFIEGRVELDRYRGRGEISRSLSWEMLAEMGKGRVEVGSHSLSHRELTGLDRAEAETEIVESAAVIERKLGTRPEWFAYPRGKADSVLAGLVRAAGYRGAVTVRPGVNRPDGDLFLLRRTEISGDDDREDFLLKLRGGFDLPHRLWQRMAGKRL
ncbi:MAG: polysaccharide deacetylase family protein [Candidatus Erginobacter occultus]|nr:polysaccharide deacetylase family protein [Candidatus Erginobacter occultus]